MKSNPEKNDATPQELATCHCIIGHPHKAKFLAIRHQTGWTVPTLKFPPGSADFRAAAISKAVQQKYGLLTRVLRPLVTTAHYHCIELELCKGGSGKKLDAVWVDREQYQNFRSAGSGGIDPFDVWLQEKERGIIPPLRPAWQAAGWFKQADHWIHYQGERLGFQITGGVQQFRVGWNTSCLLRVPTSEGMVFFKASYSKPPVEAALVPFLAERWPQFVAPPLAVDLERNWILSRDLTAEGVVSPDCSFLPRFVRALATLQVESMTCMDELKALGCPVRDLSYLADWAGHSAGLLPLLQSGLEPLNESEVGQVPEALAAYAQCCRQLLEYPVPSALVHDDFRVDNLALQGDTFHIFDWTDAVIGHPFMALEYINAPWASFQSGNAVYTPESESGKAIVKEINSAYLEGFLAFAPMPQLQQAWALAQALFPLWNLYRAFEKLDWTEASTPGYRMLEKQLKHTARKVIAASKDLTGTAA